MVLGAAAAAALGGWQAWTQGGDRALAYRDITSTVGPWQFTHVTTRTYHDREKLERYFRLAWPGHVPRLPPIDFEREEVALATAGPRSSGGYELGVVRVTEERGRIVVILRERAPTLEQPGRVGLTYPYRLLVFQRSDKRTLVRIQGRP